MRTAILLAAFVGLSSAHLAARDGSSATATAAAAATIVTNCVKPGTVALTFVRLLLLSVFQADTFVQDDGPYKYLSQILDILENAGAKGTFCVNGYNWGCIYDDLYTTYLERAFDGGHQVASHTWSHPDLNNLPRPQSELPSILPRHIDDALHKILGVIPKYFRPPYGNCNMTVLQILTENNKTALTWNVDTGDSDGNTPAQCETAFDNGMKGKNRAIVLNHETNNDTVNQVLPDMIKKLKAQNYSMVTVADCLGDSQPYLSVDQAAARDWSWTCEEEQ
ncbi:putative deacetylase [Mycena leptocephala]|nr:putative deacetylase [Mycena leptocephala]